MVHLSAANHTPMDLPLARVKFELGDHSFTHEMAVMENCAEQVLLGSDLRMLDQLIDLERERRKKVRVGAVSTREQTRLEEEQRKAGEDATARSEATTTTLEDVFDFADDLFKPARDKTKLTKGQKRLRARRVAEEKTTEELPNRQTFIQEQHGDDSLADA